MTQPSIFRWQGQHNDKRSARTFQHTDWTALLKEAQILNGGRTCVFDGPYHAGGRHIVRRLEFINGGQLWLVRIPILPTSSTSDQNEILKWWTAERRFTMESEIATMKFYANFPNIPVPMIFGHRTSIDGNPVKLPYMLMQCIKGNMLFDLGGPGILTGEQKSRIRKSIASIQVRGTPTIIFILLTSSGTVPSVKWQMPQSTSLDRLFWGQMGQLILVHSQRHLASKDRLRQRPTIFSHGLLMQNSGIWTFSTIGLKTTMSFEA
jgi:hypothetical protein